MDQGPKDKKEPPDEDFQDKEDSFASENQESSFERLLEQVPWDPTGKIIEDDEQPADHKPKVKKPLTPQTIDLHRLTLEEAIRQVEAFVSAQIGGAKGSVSLRIITGKGRHSVGLGGILIREIYNHVLKTYRVKILKIDSPPADDLVEGLPIKGYFDVTLKP